MADARKDTDYKGIGANQVTYKYDGTIVYDDQQPGGAASVGRAVTIVSNKTVGLSADGDVIEGKLIKVEKDGFCTVQFTGFCTLPGGNGATNTVPNKICGALGAAAARGYTRNCATDTERANSKCRLVDGATATALAVQIS